MKISVLNDLHVGAQRSAGTTIQSAKALRMYAVEQVRALLEGIDNDTILNGDVFDGYSVPLTDAFAIQQILSSWLSKGHKLYMLPGNHDLSSDTSKMSVFQYMALSLQAAFPAQVKYLEGSGWLVEDKVYAISHVPNQDLFDMELAKVPKCQYLLLHCNYDNGFAKEKDHSLNLSEATARELPVEQIILGHEHTGALKLGGKVVIAGNHFPMSISDCLDKQSKFRLELTVLGAMREKTWDSANYVEVNWREALSSLPDVPFIRLVGTAENSEAADVVETVSRLRKISEAFVVGSGVKVEGREDLDMDEVMASAEDVRAIDVAAMLRDILKPEQMAVLDALK